MKDEIKTLDFIEGIVFYGSHGRNDDNYYSDLDTFIYYDETGNINLISRVKKKILEILNNANEGVLDHFEIDDKWLVYTEHSFIKLEIGIKNITEAKKDAIYIIESRIQSPEQAIVYDKKGRVEKIYSENWVKLDDFEKLKQRFVSESHKFIYYFENSLSSLGESNLYGTYFNYILAFNTLVTLQSIVLGNYYNLYQPRKVLWSLFQNGGWKSVSKYLQATAGMNRPDIVNRKGKLRDLFLEVIEQGLKYFNLENTLLLRFRRLLENFDAKYPQFSNLRDISLIPNLYSETISIKEGLIYRTTSLSQYDKELVKKFLHDNDIKVILDLRGTNELERFVQYNNFYEEEIKDLYVKNLPIEPNDDLYSVFLEDGQEVIKIVFEDYFSKAATNKLIIHCEGGKDRTGILIALLLDLLGVSRKLIIEDYLLSFLDIKRDYIESVLKILDEEYGGVNNFLVNYCNVSKKAIDKIKETLVEKP
ncbi:MAG: tyrosine-protein phosphatase [Promethearchaeota archaeon]